MNRECRTCGADGVELRACPNCDSETMCAACDVRADPDYSGTRETMCAACWDSYDKLDAE